jgi:hypothetical protein
MRTKRNIEAFFGALAVGLLLAQGAFALTVEQALELSKQTGRPIFAVAGRET